MVHPTSGPLMQKSKYLTVHSDAEGQVCLISATVRISICVTPSYSCNCWQSGAISNASGLLQIFYQHSVMYHTPGTAASHLHRCRLRRWTHTRSLVTCKHPHSSTKTNKHTHSSFFFYLMLQKGSLPHTNKHSSAFPPPPPPLPLNVRARSKLRLAFDLSHGWYSCLLPCSQTPTYGV